MAHQYGYVEEGDAIGPAAQAAGDPGKGAVGYPVYRSFLQQALEKLSFEVPWDFRVLDVAISETRIVQLPPKYVGIKNIYIYRGDTCNPTTSVRVIVKENYTHGGERGAFQNVQWQNRENAMLRSSGWVEPWDLKYAGIQGGKLYLSPQSHGYDRVRIEYLGIGIDAFCPDEPIRVPLFARQGIIDYVAMLALEHRIYTEGKENLFTSRYKSKREECLSRGGSWQNALVNWGQLDPQQMTDLSMVTTGNPTGR
jgi:hypothetical protein